MDFLEPSWDQPYPSEAQIEEMWEQIEVPCGNEISPTSMRLKSVISKRLAEGEIIVAECWLPENNTLHWFASRNRLQELNFFSKLFQLNSVNTALGADTKLAPKLRQQANNEKYDLEAEESKESLPIEPPQAASIKLEKQIVLKDELGFEFRDSFEAIGSMGSIIYYGGPYHKPDPGSDKSAMELALNVADSAFNKRFGEAAIYVSYEPWAEWFKGIAWDSSWVLIDMRKRRMTIILITDTD